MAKGPWKPGQSGNPAGRPPKGESMTDALREHGLKNMLYRGKMVQRKVLLAQIVWKVVISGKVTLPGGKVMNLEPQHWFNYVKWLYERIDGLPKSHIDLTSDGETLTSDEMKQAIKDLKQWEKDITRQEATKKKS